MPILTIVSSHEMPPGIDLSHCIAVAICDFKPEDSRVMDFLKAMRPRTDMPYGCIAVSIDDGTEPLPLRDHQ
jgi:hypothetical protein